MREIWDVVICCVCGKYFDKETRECVEKPKDGTVMSHTYCDKCAEDLRAQIREMEVAKACI